MANARERMDIGKARLMDRREGALYCGLGKASFSAWAKQIGAERRFGRRVLFDRQVIDEALNKMVIG